MKKYLFLLIFMSLFLLSDPECKGPDGDSKPTPFKKEMVNSISYDIDADSIVNSIMIFFGIVIPALYIINKKVN